MLLNYFHYTTSTVILVSNAYSMWAEVIKSRTNWTIRSGQFKGVKSTPTLYIKKHSPFITLAYEPHTLLIPDPCSSLPIPPQPLFDFTVFFNQNRGDGLHNKMAPWRTRRKWTVAPGSSTFTPASLIKRRLKLANPQSSSTS